MSVWLVCSIALGRHVVQRDGLAISVGRATKGALNTLVRVRCLLCNDTIATTLVMAVWRTARAAADAEEPEHGAGKGE